MRAAALALWMAACVGAQPFPMRYLGELGHLPAGGRVGPAVAVAEGVVRLEGPGWRYTRGVTGGAGWTTLYTADFDADGQADFLLADHFPGVGRCVNAASLTVVLFDRAGRPVLRELATQLPRTVGDAFPFTPVVVRRRQGRRSSSPSAVTADRPGPGARRFLRRQERVSRRLADGWTNCQGP